MLSLTSIMSTTGERRAGRPKLRVFGVLMRRAPQDREGYIESFLRTFKLIGSPGFPFDEERGRAAGRRRPTTAATTAPAPAGSWRRSWPRATARQQLRSLRVPTTVVHGQADPLVPFRGGRATAAAIPDARLIAIPGMGHDLPREVWPQLIDAVVETAGRAPATAPVGLARRRAAGAPPRQRPRQRPASRASTASSTSS